MWLGGVRYLVVAFGFFAACVSPNAVDCGEYVCAPGQVCAPPGCAFPEQLTACDGEVDGATCLFGDTSGACQGGVCLVVICGNAKVEPGEICDDGNRDSGDGCSATCSSEEACGNGVLDGVKGEECDDGNRVSGDGCQASCLVPRCGDGVVDATLQEECDDGPGNAQTANAACRINCRKQRCGDGVTDPLADEVCDDGNLLAGDGCTPDCASNEACGNGVVDFLAGELCDDGDRQSHDGCASQCQFETANWHQVVSGAPPARKGHATAYDARRGRVVLFGGSNYGVGADTWEWDGTTWTSRSSNRRPPQRGGGHVMAYDAARSVVILYGGTVVVDMWQWDGNDWTQRTPATMPPPRYDAEVVWDAAREKLVMFGGVSTEALGTYDETWEWDGVNWAKRSPANKPTGRSQHAMSYDPKRNKVVLYGGLIGSTVQNDTWEWDGTNWTDVTPITPSPVAGQGAAMAYDLARGTTLLFGGRSGIGYRNLTWEWNGSAWTQLSPSAAPAGRVHHTIAMDSARKRIVMFGGNDSASDLGDTWEWNGTTWTAKNTTLAPGAWAFQVGAPSANVVDFQSGFTSGNAAFFAPGFRFVSTSDSSSSGNRFIYWNVANMSYLVKAGDVIEYDVRVDSSATSTVGLGGIDLKNSDGTYWRDTPGWADQYGISGHPSTNLGAYAHGEWYHRALPVPASMVGKTVVQWDVVNENDSASTTTNVYYDNLVISRPGSFPPAITAPAPRADAALVADAAGGVLLLYGGFGETPSRDTWEWNGREWIQRLPTTFPLAHSSHAMAYDAARGRVVLFGGFSSAGYMAQTWEWHDGTWTQRFPTNAPSARLDASMVYDAARNRVLLFGGYAQDGLKGDMWQWDGTDWAPLSPPTSPSARRRARMVYDAARQRVVLVGGLNGPTDTWEWDGITWTNKQPAASPPQLEGFAIAYHAARGRTVLFGGRADFTGEATKATWEWDGNTWTELFPATSPPGRDGHVMAYDAPRGNILVFGGRDASSGTINDTWIYRYDSSLPEERCLAFDGDGDQLAGCADDDCVGFCAPLCPPNTSCDPAWPACGDGTCQPIEGCRLCPADCGACELTCGDLICDPGENATACPGDC